MKTYKGPITKLLLNQIFVFGSNTEGRHGKGAALWAVRNAGAIYGEPIGLQGQSYAIITKDLAKIKHPSINTEYIVSQIETLYNLAITMPDKEFLIAYSNKPNLNGYTPEEMAYMFGLECGTLPPDNIVFEEEFAKLLTY